MHKFPITQYNSFSDLPLDMFNTFKYSIYIINFDWDYIFINECAKKNLGTRANDLEGKNMWSSFPELAQESSFMKMKADVEKGNIANFTLMSPILGKRLHVFGYRMQDCYYFTSSILPDKNDLISELRGELKKNAWPQ